MLSYDYIRDNITFDYDNGVLNLTSNGTDDFVKQIFIDSTNNDAAVPEVCRVLDEVGVPYVVISYTFEGEEETIIDAIYDANGETIVFDNRMGTGPHMQWIYDSNVLDNTPFEQFIWVNYSGDEYWTAM